MVSNFTQPLLSLFVMINKEYTYFRYGIDFLLGEFSLGLNIRSDLNLELETRL